MYPTPHIMARVMSGTVNVNAPPLLPSTDLKMAGTGCAYGSFTSEGISGNTNTSGTTSATSNSSMTSQRVAHTKATAATALGKLRRRSAIP